VTKGIKVIPVPLVLLALKVFKVWLVQREIRAMMAIQVLKAQRVTKVILEIAVLLALKVFKVWLVQREIRAMMAILVLLALPVLPVLLVILLSQQHGQMSIHQILTLV
jgi:hypothetical protein